MIREKLFLLEKIMIVFFSYKYEKKIRWLPWVYLASLYLLGIYIWGKFFDWGLTPLNYHDWAHLFIPRLHMMKEALLMGTLPFHVIDKAPLLHVSDRYFVLPDVITTPQMLLLIFLDINEYVFYDTIIHYTIAVLGLLLIRNQKQLSLFGFTIIFFLFIFNGHIVSHYSVGHLNWAGYFLLPIVFSLLFELTSNNIGWWWVTRFSFTLLYMVLAGSLHHFVWIFLFTFPLIFIYWRNAKWIILGLLFSGVLCAVRLLPPALALQDYQTNPNFNFVLGYPSIGHLLQAMIIPSVAVETEISPYVLNTFSENYWEFSFYIGLLGTFFIIYFGLFHWIRYNLSNFSAYIPSVFLLIFLSMGGNFWLVRLTGIPIFDGERVASRMIVISLTFLMVLAAIFFERWLENSNERRWVRIISLVILILGVSDLWSNLKLWRISNYSGYFMPSVINLGEISVTHRIDPEYFLVLIIGLSITILTTIFLVAITWWTRKILHA